MEKDYTLEDAPFHLDTDGLGYNALFFATFRLCNVSSTYAKTPFSIFKLLSHKHPASRNKSFCSAGRNVSLMY